MSSSSEALETEAIGESMISSSMKETLNRERKKG